MGRKNSLGGGYRRRSNALGGGLFRGQNDGLARVQSREVICVDYSSGVASTTPVVLLVRRLQGKQVANAEGWPDSLLDNVELYWTQQESRLTAELPHLEFDELAHWWSMP